MSPLLLYTLVYHTFVFSHGQTNSISASSCILQGLFEPSFLANGHFMIGGLFPLHYRVEMFHPRAFRWAQTMRFAVEEINQNRNLLPNFTLGYEIYDSCATHVGGQRAILAALNGPEEAQSAMCSGTAPLLVVIGDSGSSQSIVVSGTLNQQVRMYIIFTHFQISYFSTCSCLSDRKKYPTFFRVIPSDDYQVKAITRLLLQFGWKWVGMIAEDDDYGRYALQGLLREFRNIGVCLAYYEMIPKVYNQRRIHEILRVMKQSTAKVVIAFAGEGELYPLLKEYMDQNITGIQWIASEAWVTASIFTDYLLTVNPLRHPKNALVQELWGVLYGCFLQTPNGTSQNFPQLPACTGQEPLLDTVYVDTSNLRLSYCVYKAVYAIAYSLHNLISCEPGKGPFQNSSCADPANLYPWQVGLLYVLSVKMPFILKEVNFDEKGDSVPSYDLINWQRDTSGKIQFINVGMFDGAKDAGKELFIKEDVLVSVCSDSCTPGSRKAVRRGEPLCCFDCVPCDDGKISNQTDSVDCTPCPEDYWSNTARTECIPKAVEFLTHDAMGLTLTVISVVGACLTAAILLVFIRHRNTPIVRVNNSELSFFILLSLILCFLCALLFIGEPTVWSCMLRHTAFSITFSLCISCILGKTLVVLAAFTATRPGNNIMKWLGPKQQRVIIFACTLVQVLICSVWLIAAPPFPFKNTQYSRSKIILECSVGSDWAFWSVLGYIGLLACLCFVLAFLARKLPGNFNEAKYITFSILIFCAVWLAFIPAYVSSPGKFTVAVEIFAILASSFGLLLCLFAPKCYIILLKPQKNTKSFILLYSLEFNENIIIKCGINLSLLILHL
uniref:G-protein coupled receptors family 3 profile domain-containing protein n=1 Tax=Scleropages formosus TaxID=113540 RepID=A0A8C9T403_SCLFO